MEQLKVTLNRQIGPFKVWQWLVVVVGGVLVGLMIRNRLGGGEPEGSTLGATDDLESLTPTQGAPTIVQQDFDTTRALQQDQDRFQDELDALAQSQENIFTELIERINQINQPSEPERKFGGSSKPPPANPPAQGSQSPKVPKWSGSINGTLKRHYNASDAVKSGVGTNNKTQVTRSTWSKANHGDQSGVAGAIIREFTRLNLAVPGMGRLRGLIQDVRVEGRNITGGKDSIRAGLEAHVANKP